VAAEKAAVAEMNAAAMNHMTYAPTGFYKTYQAWRSNVSGVVGGPLPFFWGVNKS
jgi:peptide/nickel transport system substrate-binding protein